MQRVHCDSPGPASVPVPSCSAYCSSSSRSLCVCLCVFIDFLLWPHETLLKMRFSRFLLLCFTGGAGRQREGSRGHCLVLAIVFSAWHVVVAFDADFKLPLAWLCLSLSLPFSLSCFLFTCFRFAAGSFTPFVPFSSPAPLLACVKRYFYVQFRVFQHFPAFYFAFFGPSHGLLLKQPATPQGSQAGGMEGGGEGG